MNSGNERARLGARALRDAVSEADGNKSQRNYKVSSAFQESLPCTCHERRPCRVCTAWREYYRYTRAAIKALDAIAPRPALRFIKREWQP
jgi:hypothetical protein